MGVLLFQDLAVVPLLVLIPALGSPPEVLLREVAIARLQGRGPDRLAAGGRPALMRWWLTLVARRKSEELFVLNLLLVTLGLAWLTELAGLSLALGAFIAGILISETEYKHQVETDIRPFHDVLLGLFFITIGMLLDWRPVAERWRLVLVLLTLPVLFKLLLVTGLAKLFGATGACRCAPGCTWRRPVNSASCCWPWPSRTSWCRPRCSTRSSPAWCSRCWRRPSSSSGATGSS